MPRDGVFVLADEASLLGPDTQANGYRLVAEGDVKNTRELLPVLKWVRGEALSPDHWAELFRLIDLPCGTRLDDLTFGSILTAAPQILAQADALKHLTLRAQGEVVVREALQELDVWGAGATFSLTPYTDSKGRCIRLVKDWTDIVTQVCSRPCRFHSSLLTPGFGGV
ncbi:unnamed protein product [Mesocestoides corti]|nr:unnamed protein product [Mesocestoides corti]